MSRRRVLSARSVSETVAVSIDESPLQGWVLSCFPTACNLTDDTGRVVSLVAGAVGDGPLNIVVDGEAPFDGIGVDMEARIDKDEAIVGDGLVVHLREAEKWNPVVKWEEITAAAMATLWEHVQEKANPDSLLTVWVPLIRPVRGVRMALHETVRATAGRLLLALHRGDQVNIAASATVLAGLGPGSTPAGDDFLVGLMAGLRARPQFLAPGSLPADDACALVSQAATLRTHAFSTAHLRAAQTGQMSVGWHRLAGALAASDENAIKKAVDRLLALGASSGADAIAGFVGPYLLAGTFDLL